MSLTDAALYEKPFQHVLRHVRPVRENDRRKNYRERWWLFAEARPGMRRALSGLDRFIGTSVTGKHRPFVWRHHAVLPRATCVAIACDDDVTFGILSSRFHTLWAWRKKGELEDRPRYTPTTTFDPFPFPEPLWPGAANRDGRSAASAAPIAEAARRLNELRENWLHPGNLVRHIPGPGPELPDRILPVDAAAAAHLARRTLTKLYNEQPAWLADAQRALDAAVAAAYGWRADLSDEEVLRRLFELNQERAATRTAQDAASAAD
jgi:hypothetical protein